MATNDQYVEAVSAPTKLSYPFFRQTTGDWIATLLLAVGCFIALLRYDLFGFIVAGMPSLWLLWPGQYGKHYYTMWENTIVSWWYLVVLEGYLWENKNHPDYVPRQVALWKRGLKWVIRISHPYPFRVDSINQVDGFGVVSDVGLIFTERTNSYAAVVEARGSKIPNLSLQDQSARLDSIAGEIQRLAYLKGMSARVSFVFMRRPASIVAHEEVMDISLVPDVVVPRALLKLDGFIKSLETQTPALSFAERITKLREESDKLYKDEVLTREETRDFRLFLTSQEAQEAVRTIGNDPWMVALIMIRRNAQLAKASSGEKSLSADEGSQQDIIQLINTFSRQLELTGVHEPHVLNREETEDYLAAATNAVMLDEYRERAFNEVSHGDLDVYHPQIAIEVTRDLAVIDGTGHAVFKITGLPSSILPTDMAGLVNGVRNVRWISRTLTSESGTGTNEYRAAVWMRNVLEDVLGFTGLKAGRKTEIRQIGADTRQQQLADQGHVEYINIYLAVAAETPSEVANAAIEIDKSVRSLAATARCIRVTGAARMCRMALTATVGIPH